MINYTTYTTSDNLQIGKAGEHLVCADLILQGYNAFLTDQGTPYDIIVETIAGLKRIQVKTCQKNRSYPNSKDVYRFGMRRAKKGLSKISSDTCDYIAFVALDIKKIAYVDVREITNSDGLVKSCVELRDRNKPWIGRTYSNGTIRSRYGRFIDQYEKFCI